MWIAGFSFLGDLKIVFVEVIPNIQFLVLWMDPFIAIVGILISGN